MSEPVELPFTAIDEGIYHLEVNTNPWNIQVEAGASGRLDRARLDDAVLGKVPELPTFEDDGGEPTELWFSPPCAVPLTVGVGVATVGNALHLSVRYRLEQFDSDAAEKFADLLVAQLSRE